MATKQKVSEREYLDSQGNTVERIELATGARYSIGQKVGDDFKVTKSFDAQFGGPAELSTMCAVLGFHTKCGNVANTVLNDKDAPGSIDDAAAAIAEFITLAESGKWAERVGGGGGGLRYDVDAMALAIAKAKSESDPAPYLAKMDSRFNNKGESVAAAADGTFPKGSISYAALAYRNAKVRAIYDAAKGAGTDLGSL